MLKYLLIGYAVMSVLAFLAYGIDKRKAQKKHWRTPETVLLCLGFFGGSAGALLGMNIFRHKTRRWYFWAVNVIGLIWQIGLIMFWK